MVFVAFAFLSLLSGALLARIARRGVPLLSPRGVIEIALLALILPSFVGIVLVESNHFRVEWIVAGLSGGIAALLGVLVLVERRIAVSASSHQPHRVHLIPLLVCLAIGAAFRYPTMNYVRGGQDPGVYVNIANSLALRGELTIVDPLAEPLSKRDTALGKLYFKESYRAMACKPDGGCRGSFQPGFYLRGIAPSEITPQFYHLHSIWMAFSNLALGGENTTSILFIFGLLCLAVFYLLLVDISRGKWTPFIGTLLLAASPAYAYFARFPVSEVTTSLFFLSSLYFFSVSRLSRLPEAILGALFAGLFFFTHITGFILLIPLYPALLLGAYRGQLRTPTIGWSLTLTLFLWSLYHGLTWSRPYSMAIWSKIGLPDAVLDFVVSHTSLVGIATLFLSLLPLIFISSIKGKLPHCIEGFTPSKRLIATGGIIAVGAFGIYLALKGWRLGYTDHYAANKWIGRRWNLSGHGVWSLKHLTPVVLTFFVSPVIVLMAGLGWVRTLRRALTSPRAALLCLTAVALALALVGKQTTAPYLYYFGRYLTPTLVPIAILFGILGLETVQLRRSSATVALRGALIVLALACMLPFTWAQARATEAGELYAELKRLAATVGPRSLIFVDEVNFARVELTTPLQISFGIPTITYSRRNLTGEPLRALMAEAQALGYTVYLLSEKDRGSTLPFLLRVESFEFFLGSLVAREDAIMPTVFRAGKQRATLHRFEPSISAVANEVGR
jgi:hypothetical protein